MKKSYSVAILALAFGLINCRSVQGEESSLVLSDASVEKQGVDAKGEPCTFSFERDSAGKLTAISLKGTFDVDYKIPAPLSGLYGKYRWPASFTGDRNLKDSGIIVKRSLLGDADVIHGQGEYLFGNTQDSHKLVIKPSIDQAETISYSSPDKLLSIYYISMECRL